MSLVPTYVRLADGKWYKDPVFRVWDDGSFICMDDDDPPELVSFNILRGHHAVSLELTRLGFSNADIRSGTMACMRQPLDKRSRFKQAATWWIHNETGVISPEHVVENDGVYVKTPNRQGVYYDWSTHNPPHLRGPR
jgi:hypothetical protein